ncbi:ATP-dependent Clp protease proteolytic subunit [Kalamiella sp. sgz302252]|uniref:ATP-dependent Clp protease proteolytic subunit n=1 Tax=Pantoea sp. sgz302252 TaxID=3341827 RepID=UPI0036D3E67D
MKRITAVTLCGALACCAFSAAAAISVTQRTDGRPTKFTQARIFFNGNVTANKALELAETLHKFNLNYPALREITLYLNSYGGDMDGGYIAAQAVANSTIPVTTVNISMTASAATLIYCAGKQRLTLPLATFVLHPAAAENSARQYVKADELLRLKQLTDRYNLMFKKTYQRCTSLSEEAIDALLASESSRAMLDASQAVTSKLATGITEKLAQADISLTLTDSLEP